MGFRIGYFMKDAAPDCVLLHGAISTASKKAFVKCDFAFSNRDSNKVFIPINLYFFTNFISMSIAFSIFV
ncbi:hypothetical protein D3C87_356090 [compost metagenome]